jgi:hypothetical protein
VVPQSFADGLSSAQSSVVASQDILDAEKAGLVDVNSIPNASRSALLFPHRVCLGSQQLMTGPKKGHQRKIAVPHKRQRKKIN